MVPEASKTLYLFGAGASAQKLPVINNFHKHLNLTKENEYYKDKIDWDDPFIKDLNEVYFKELLRTIHNYGSPDTYAKICYEQRKVKGLISSVKMHLGAYFAFAELYLGLADTRYQNFIARHYTEMEGFNPNIKILTWNYDAQFEIAQQNIEDVDVFIEDQNIIHLNGNYYSTCAYNLFKVYKHPPFLLPRLTGIDSTSDFKRVLSEIVNVAIEGIKFAFEQGDYLIDRIDKFAPFFDECEYLVCIGYSFPDFNRTIDRYILKKIQEGKALQRIFIQNNEQNYDLDRFKLSFELGDQVEVKHINDGDNYTLPLTIPTRTRNVILLKTTVSRKEVDRKLAQYDYKEEDSQGEYNIYKIYLNPDDTLKVKEINAISKIKNLIASSDNTTYVTVEADKY